MSHICSFRSLHLLNLGLCLSKSSITCSKLSTNFCQAVQGNELCFMWVPWVSVRLLWGDIKHWKRCIMFVDGTSQNCNADWLLHHLARVLREMNSLVRGCINYIVVVPSVLVMMVIYIYDDNMFMFSENIQSIITILNLKVNQLFTLLHRSSSLNKQFQQNLYRWTVSSLVYWHSTCNQFHMYSTQHEGHMRNVPVVCKNEQFCQYHIQMIQFRFRSH